MGRWMVESVVEELGEWMRGGFGCVDRRVEDRLDGEKIG